MSKKTNSKDKKLSPTIALNKKARYDYELGERFEAGLVLLGTEVKSLRAGHGQITESYAVFNKDGELFLMNSLIPKYEHGTHANHEERRSRKLLLNKREIAKLKAAQETKGMSLVPTALYWKKSRAKVEIAIARGKKNYDKRATIKERDWNIQKQRLLKH